MSNASDLAKRLAQFFEARAYSWRLEDGTYITPDEDDMQLTLDAAEKRLYDDTDAILEVGRLTFHKVEGRIEVSALFGIIGEE